MKYFLFALIGFLIGAIGLPAVSARTIFSSDEATITLVADGQPQATIVTPVHANQRIVWAADELRRYVKAISGVTLPIRNDDRRVTGTKLYIGLPMKDTDLPAEKLNPESYAIRVRDGNIHFTGRWPTPTYFAVASFIEDNLGVRWYAPGELWTYIPKSTPGKLSARVRSRVVIPDTSPRVWSSNTWFPDWSWWNMRNKTAGGEVVPRRNFQNNLYKVFPPSKYAQSHPEYYPMINGKHWIPPNDQSVQWMPELTDPDVIRLTAEYAHQYFQTHPYQDSFSLGQDDIIHWSDKDRAQLPDSYYRFVNAVAKRVQATDPGKYVGTLIYHEARQIPKTINHLEPNVFGFLVQHCFEWWQPGHEAADKALSRQWAGMCDHLSRYDYFGLGTITPRFAPHYMADAIKFDKSLGFEGMFTEISTFMPHTAPMMWALAKMEWDSSLNINDLLDEFYDDMYGSASPTMHEYFDLLEHAWTENRPGRTHDWVNRNIIAQAQAMTPSQLDQGMAMLNRALAEADDPESKKRIEIHLAALRYSGYVIDGYALSQKIAQASVTDNASASRVLDLTQKLSALAREREVFWAKAHDRDDLLGETIRGLGDQKHYLQIDEWIHLEKQAIGGGAFKSLLWFAAHNTSAQYHQRIAELKATTGDAFDEMIHACAVIQDKARKNLIQNGDFETSRRETPNAQKNRATLAVPPYWSFWSRNQHANYGVAAGKGRDGSTAVFIRDADNGVFLQTCPVKPGQKYLLTGWVKMTPPAARRGVARIDVNFRAPGGTWAGKDRSSSQSISAGDAAGWQPLMLVITIPEGVSGLVIMPSGSNLSGPTTAWFDDLAMYQLE